MNENTILITGANGEMGRGLISMLHNDKANNNIIAMDIKNIDNSISSYCSTKIIGDILNVNLINEINKKYNIKTIYHLAALLSTQAELNPKLAHDINVEGTLNLLNLALQQGKSQEKKIKFFFPSSIAVYGLKNLKEKYNAGIIDEKKFHNPTTIYGCNKLYCEHLGNYYANNYSKNNNYIDFRSIRFPGIISSQTIPSGGTSDYIPEMLHAAAQNQKYYCFVRDNTQIPFMTMPDAIDAITKIMNAPKNNLKSTVYNVRAFSPTAEEFRKQILQFFPNAIIKYKINSQRQKMVDGWPMDTDDSAAKKDWKWKPKYNLQSSLSQYLIPELIKIYN